MVVISARLLSKKLLLKVCIVFPLSRKSPTFILVGVISVVFPPVVICRTI